jgi:type II secretory pathway pseudopilin PulG
MIELVAAMVLLTIIIVPVGRLFMDSFKYQSKSQKNTEIAKAAEYVAEKLKNGDYAALTISDFTDESIVEVSSSSFPTDFPTTDDYNVQIKFNLISDGVTEIGNIPDTYDAEVTLNTATIGVNDGTGLIESSVPDYANKKLILTIAGTTGVDKTLLIENTTIDDWSVFINNKSSNKIYIYLKKTLDTNGAIYVLGTPETIGSFIAFNLGIDSTAQKVEYEVYEATINVTGTETQAYTLSTTIRREKRS